MNLIIKEVKVAFYIENIILY